MEARSGRCLARGCWRAQRIAVPRSASQKKGRFGITDEFSATPRVTPVIDPDPAIARLDFHEENRRQALQGHEGVVDIR